jgi:hypothetical protein
MDIYQRIWDADQAGSGIQPVISPADGSPDRGFVQVNTVDPDNPAALASFKVLGDPVIPAAKKRTYDLVRRLFDNYALAERDPEVETADEREEVHDLLAGIVESPPMQVAREYVAEITNTAVSRERWYATLLEHWFRQFAMGGDPMLTGFEHIVVGEQQGSKVQGYHFWYKYHLDDGLATTIGRHSFPGLKDDQIVYIRSKSNRDQDRFPESVTISYKWKAPDYDRNAIRPLTKPTGGFFVGCSIEGLMAIGSVRAHLGANAPKEAVINGGRYKLELHRSDNNQHIRTFYPVFLGPAAAVSAPGGVVRLPDGSQPPAPPAEARGSVRILAALVNPVGDDPGSETVTIINVGSGKVSMEGWVLRDKMDNRLGMPAVDLVPGVAHSVRLPKNSVQLSNKGGTITLFDRRGAIVHSVSYSKSQASEEGRTIVF